MVSLLIVLAVIAGVIGIPMLSNATLGVGLIGLGCLFAILGRVAQAHHQHRELRAALTPVARETT